MYPDSLTNSAEYIEYLVIGLHTMIGLGALILLLLGLSPSLLLGYDPLALVVVLPVALVIGTIADSLYERMLTPIRNIVKRLAKSEGIEDEEIAARSATLYYAYEWRIRRARIPGSAIFNWPLLGLVILFTFGSLDTPASHIVLLATILLTIASFLAWLNLCDRAYTFRRKAYAQLAEGVAVATA